MNVIKILKLDCSIKSALKKNMKNMWWLWVFALFYYLRNEKIISLCTCLSQSWNTLGAFFVVVYFGGLFFAWLFKCWGMRDTEDMFCRKNMLTYILIITESHAAM